MHDDSKRGGQGGELPTVNSPHQEVTKTINRVINPHSEVTKTFPKK